ncbi:MAG: PorV/PorQ family protein [Melioribacteraceae bacterium]|nr:PorV/PorQ family protein [Melioribacteraceae bacterium]WKZ70928.1 MAG: PorV/PorQ family protein [Melioribacteraceae bacterium]
MKRFFFCFLFIALVSGNLHAQLFPTLGGQRAGISTAQFLKIGVGGRATAMGDAFIAVANDASALYWNPAGLVQTKRDEILISHNQWLVDISHQFIGGIYHISSNDVIGVSLTALHMDDMPVTTEVRPFGTGEYFTFADLAIGFTYSRKMTEQFSFGGTIKYFEETLDKLKMRGIMIDLGTYYWTGLGSTRFAVTISNFGNELAPDGEVVLFGNRKQSEWQSFSPPTIFRFGIALEPYQDEQHRVTASAQLNHPNDNSENVSAGVEYSWKEILYVRGGYKINVEGQDFTFGAGVSAPISFADITFDYAYAKFSKLGSAHRFSLLLGF